MKKCFHLSNLAFSFNMRPYRVVVPMYEAFAEVFPEAG